MTAKAQVKTQAKTPAAPAAARIPQPPVAAPEREAERPDIAAQLEGAARLGHSLGDVNVDSPGLPIIQRQEIPEEEEEELQMKREPAALQRQELPEEEEEEVQTKPVNDVQRQGGGEGFQLDGETAGRINRARGGGQPLEDVLQAQMSEALGHDFSGVRLHTDSEADALNQQLQAIAFTTGADILFKRGAYDPGSGSGRELLTHELWHVVQQGAGRVRGHGTGHTVCPADDPFEQEADSQASQAAGPSHKEAYQETTCEPAQRLDVPTGEYSQTKAPDGQERHQLFDSKPQATQENRKEHSNKRNYHILQRRVEEWPDYVLPGGTTVYHVTSAPAAENIRNQGINDNMISRWGEPYLGQGFYTHTNLNTADAYCGGIEERAKIAIEFKTKESLAGQIVPPGQTWDRIGFHLYRDGNDFLTDQTLEEIKFHQGSQTLRINRILHKTDHGWEEVT